MRKECEHPKEIYMTKLVNLFYQGQENLYKIRSPKESDSDLQQILVKFIPNVAEYKDFEKEVQNFDDEKFDEIKKKIDKKSVLKLLVANFLIQNVDVNTGNILVKNQNEKITLIPIDFASFMTDEDFSHLKNFNEDILNFSKNIKEKNFLEAKKILIEKYAARTISFKEKDLRNGLQIQGAIDLEYQIFSISDKEFKEILTEMFSEYEGMKNMLEDYKSKVPKEAIAITGLEKNLDNLKEAVDSLQEKNQKQETRLSIDSIDEIVDLSKNSNQNMLS